MLRHHLSRASRDPGRSALQAAPLRNLCVRRLPSLPRASRGLGRGAGACPELLRALDSSSLGLTLNFQLSTFNRVSFLSPSSPHLCALCVLCGENSSSFRSSLIPRNSPLTTNSFTIRTSEKLSCKSFRIRTYKKVGGGGHSCHSGIRHTPLVTAHYVQVLSFQAIPNSFALVKNSTLLFSCNSGLFGQNTRGWGYALSANPLRPLRLSVIFFRRAIRALRWPTQQVFIQPPTADRRSRPCRGCQLPQRGYERWRSSGAAVIPMRRS